MNELIKITEHDGRRAVSARELYDFLGVKRDFSNWCKQMFEYGFQEGSDFTPLLAKSTGGRPSIDYALTIECAKEIAMIQRSPKGKEAREYFIACEKVMREMAKPKSMLDILDESIRLLREQEQRVTCIEGDVKELKAKTTTRPDYFTVIGYATLNNIKLTLQQAATIGGNAARLCKKYGYEMDTMPDPRFGRVRMYPTSVLKEVFI